MSGEVKVPEVTPAPTVSTEKTTTEKPEVQLHALPFARTRFPYIASINIFPTEDQFKDYLKKISDPSKLTLETARPIYAYIVHNASSQTNTSLPYLYKYWNETARLLEPDSAVKDLDKLTFDQVINPGGFSGFSVND